MTFPSKQDGDPNSPVRAISSPDLTRRVWSGRLHPDQLADIRNKLAKEDVRRKTASIPLLSVLVDGTEHVTFEPKTLVRFRFPVQDSAEVIEVQTRDKQGDLLLGVHLLNYDVDNDPHITSSVVLEGGQTLSFTVIPGSSDVEIYLTYQEPVPTVRVWMGQQYFWRSHVEQLCRKSPILCSTSAREPPQETVPPDGLISSSEVRARFRKELGALPSGDLIAPSRVKARLKAWLKAQLDLIPIARVWMGRQYFWRTDVAALFAKRWPLARSQAPLPSSSKAWLKAQLDLIPIAKVWMGRQYFWRTDVAALFAKRPLASIGSHADLLTSNQAEARLKALIPTVRVWMGQQYLWRSHVEQLCRKRPILCITSAGEPLICRKEAKARLMRELWALPVFEGRRSRYFRRRDIEAASSTCPALAILLH